MATIEILLSSRKFPGLVALIDEEDRDLVLQHAWSPTAPDRITKLPRYARAVINGRDVMLHRFLMGEPPEIVDHRNGNGFDCRRGNLRTATSRQNSRNQKVSTRNRSGVKGVRWCSVAEKWTAYISIEGKQHHLGAFETKEEATVARQTVELEHFGEFSRLHVDGVSVEAPAIRVTQTTVQRDRRVIRKRHDPPLSQAYQPVEYDPESNRSRLGHLIVQTRRHRNMSQVALSKATGLSRSYLCDIERNRGTQPSNATLRKISAALGIPMSSLWDTPKESESVAAALEELQRVKEAIAQLQQTVLNLETILAWSQ